MASYRLVFKRSVAKDLRAFPKADVAAILRRTKGLADDPRPPGCEKLSGQDRYRVRLGAYRIFYEIRDEELMVTVVKVGHRRDVYRRNRMPSGQSSTNAGTHQLDPANPL